MRSILFIKDMYDATCIHKNKTETRRTHALDKHINKEPGWKLTFQHIIKASNNRLLVGFRKGAINTIIKSKFKVGEVLYLAEPMWVKKEEGINPGEWPHYYIYSSINESGFPDYKLKELGYKKTSKMFMRQEFGRRFIKITDIYCERVNSITTASIIKEGIQFKNRKLLKAAYATLFDEVNGAGSWYKNPFVFVYVYEYLPNHKRRSTNA